MHENIFKLKKLNYDLRSTLSNLYDAWKIKKYMRNGRKPWTNGYDEFKKKFINDVLEQKDLIERFIMNRSLPDNYGYRLDERVVEYPWLFSRLGIKMSFLLDAGSVLNYKYLLLNKCVTQRYLVIYNLKPEQVVSRNNISYIYGDLRNTILKSECFDEIVCLSTLEHIGMNNQFLYSDDSRYNEFSTDSYLDAIKEFKRLLKKGGKLYISVPYGRYENHGWLQQFDASMLEKMIETFGGGTKEITFYRYVDDGWQVSDADECADCSYFDFHNMKKYEPNFVAAAQAVACIEISN